MLKVKITQNPSNVKFHWGDLLDCALNELWFPCYVNVLDKEEHVPLVEPQFLTYYNNFTFKSYYLELVHQ